MTEEVNIIKIFEPFMLGKCRCGGHCNEDMRIRNKRGFLKRFIKGHNGRGNTNPLHINPLKLDKHPNWKGGRTANGVYSMLKVPDHPYGDKQRYVMSHRLVYEHYLLILMDEVVFIPPEYDVHHIIPVKKGGTNALINLQLMLKSEHTRFHRTIDMSGRACLLCGSKTTALFCGRPHWMRFGDGFICMRCWKQNHRKPR
jgi:hypothetical protein